MGDAPKKEDEKKPAGPKVGEIAKEAIAAGKTNEEALAAVKEKVPDAKTTLASINWYRNDMRSRGVKGADGKDIPTSRDLKKARGEKDAKAGEKDAKAGEKKSDAKAKDPLEG